MRADSRVGLVVVILSFGLLILGGCSTAAPAPQLHPRWVKNKGLPTALVFVHGMSGDGTSTWTNPITKAYFPKLVADDPEFDADVYVYEYAAPVTGGTFRIDELAEGMRLALERNRVLEHRRLVFVAHSMGGLVTRGFLLKNRAIAGRVAFLYFFATPSSGADLARILSAVSSSPPLEEVGRLDPSLADLQRAWLAAELRIPTYCAYERRPMFGRIVVDEMSAMNLCDRRVDPIDVNHVDIVKPEGRHDTPYSALLTAFRDAEARRAAIDAPKVSQQQPTTPPTPAKPSPSPREVPVAPDKGQPQVNAGPGSAISINQQGGITAGTVNINPGILEPKFAFRELRRNEPVGDGFKTEFLMEIETQAAIPNLYLRVNAATITHMEVGPQRSGGHIIGHSGVSDGFAFTNLQSAYGTYRVVVFTKRAETLDVEYDPQYR